MGPAACHALCGKCAVTYFNSARTAAKAILLLIRVGPSLKEKENNELGLAFKQCIQRC